MFWRKSTLLVLSATLTSLLGGRAFADDAVTYYEDVEPIIQGRCVACHQPNGIAPFSLRTYEDVANRSHLVADAVGKLRMPPWLAAKGCAEYSNDHSLTLEQIQTITRWAREGAPEGDPSLRGLPIAPVGSHLSRVDLEVGMEAPFTPTVKPDEYRCFILDWPSSAAHRYVTGFSAVPGNRSIVHHLVAYLAPPQGVAQAQQLDAADPGPGYSCFGDAGVDTATWLAVWAPGTQGVDFPAGTGIDIPKGSKIVLQVHYHGHGNHRYDPPAEPPSDQSKLQYSTAARVDKPARLITWLNPTWLDDRDSMLIPAGDGDVRHEFSGDLAEAIGHGRPVKIYGVFHHMHQLGKEGQITIERRTATSDRECLVDIPRWNFNWQLQYWLKEPRVIQPGEYVRVACQWDNSRANQPVVDGVRLEPRDVAWGNGSRDEMCLGTLYVTVE